MSLNCLDWTGKSLLIKNLYDTRIELGIGVSESNLEIDPCAFSQGDAIVKFSAILPNGQSSNLIDAFLFEFKLLPMGLLTHQFCCVKDGLRQSSIVNDVIYGLISVKPSPICISKYPP